MRGQDEEVVTLTKPTLTVGQLRARLAGAPDDLPIQVWLPEEPGRDGPGDLWTTLILAEAESEAPNFFRLDADYEPGEYYRSVR